VTVAEISRSTAEVAGTTSEISTSISDFNETADYTGERAHTALLEAQARRAGSERTSKNAFGQGRRTDS